MPLIYWPFGDEHACQVGSCRVFHDGSSPFRFIIRTRAPRPSFPRAEPPEETAGT